MSLYLYCATNTISMLTCPLGLCQGDSAHQKNVLIIIKMKPHTKALGVFCITVLPFMLAVWGGIPHCKPFLHLSRNYGFLVRG